MDGSGNVYVTGASAEPGTARPDRTRSTCGVPMDYLLKLDGSGVYQWHTFYHAGGGIAIDRSGNVYEAGGDDGTWNGPAGQNPLNAYSGGDDILLRKLDSSGAYQWHTFYGSVNDEGGYFIAIDSSGNFYITGSGASWKGPAGQNPLHACGTYDIFVLKLQRLPVLPVVAILMVTVKPIYCGGTKALVRTLSG